VQPGHPLVGRPERFDDGDAAGEQHVEGVLRLALGDEHVPARRGPTLPPPLQLPEASLLEAGEGPGQVRRLAGRHVGQELLDAVALLGSRRPGGHTGASSTKHHRQSSPGWNDRMIG
jgi:hypothetical protein